MNTIHIILNWAIPFVCTGVASYVIKELHDNKENNKAMTQSMLALTRSQIVSKCETYLKKGYLPDYARHCLEELFKNYKALGGNHGIEVLVEKCFNLPLGKEKEDERLD